MSRLCFLCKELNTFPTDYELVYLNSKRHYQKTKNLISNLCSLNSVEEPKKKVQSLFIEIQEKYKTYGIEFDGEKRYLF